MVTFCPKCGSPAVDDQSLFCNRCGTQLPLNSAEEPGNYCPNCKTKIHEGEMACSRCGFPLSPQPPSIQPVRPSNNCPACGAPVLDENRYYCKTCGAYLRDKQERKASQRDDSSSGPKASGKKPVIIPGIHQNSGTRTIIKPEPVVMKRTIDLSNPAIKKIGILVFVLVGTVLLVWSGISLLQSSTIMEPDRDALITQDLGSMALTLNDFPGGWIHGETESTPDVFFTQFFTGSDTSMALVEQTITRFPGIEEARLELDSERAQATGVTPETLNIGNGGFGYIDVNYVMVIFRRGNVIVKIEDTRTDYQDNPTMNNAKNYAEITAKRIT